MADLFKRPPAKISKMSMTTRMLIFILATFAALIAVIFTASKLIITNSFSNLEKNDTEQNTQRAVNALSASMDSLDKLNYNWSQWDDCYNFAQDHNQGFLDSNAGDTAFVRV